MTTATPTSVEKPVDSWLRAILAVGPEGQGNPEAAQAWTHLKELDAAELPTLLKAFRGANPLAVNWLGAAIDAVATEDFAGEHVDSVTSELSFDPFAVQEYCLGCAGAEGRRNYRGRYLAAPRDIFEIIQQT